MNRTEGGRRTGRIPSRRLSAGARNLTSDLVNTSWERVKAVAMVGPQDRRGRRFRHMGPGSGMAFPRGDVFGEAWISIGAGTLLCPFVTLSAGLPGIPLDPDGPPLVTIGRRCNIGRGSFIISLVSITIGDDVTIAPNVYITDHNHTYDDPGIPIGRQWPSEAPVRIGSGCWLGTGVVVLPGTDLGRNVTVAAGSVVRGVVPDHSVVAGSPARIVRRHDPQEGWMPPPRQREMHPPPGWSSISS